MSGSAALDTNVLIDDLVADVDALKSELYADFGCRAFNVQTVLRTWQGDMIGDGGYSDVVTTLSPPPLVKRWDGYRWVLMAAGTQDDGEVQIVEVSLSYTYDELAGPADIADNQQFFYRLTDAHGQGQIERTLRIKKPPHVDREKDMGWILWLMNMNTPSGAPVVETP